MNSLHNAVFDDDPEITLLLVNYLSAQGWHVFRLHDAAALSGRTVGARGVPLDVPGLAGWAAAGRHRGHHRAAGHHPSCLM